MISPADPPLLAFVFPERRGRVIIHSSTSPHFWSFLCGLQLGQYYCASSCHSLGARQFLLRFGLNNVSELPSIEEFEKLGDPQADLFNASPALEAPTSELEDPSAESSSQAAVAVAGEAQSAEDASQSRHNQQKQS